MKTTLDLPDDLLIAAKKRAAETRTTLRSLVARGLRRELAGGEPAAKPRGKIRWVVVDGGLPPGLELEDRTRVYDWLARNR